MLKTVKTPWGNADHAEYETVGVTFYSTPSHGGYKVTPEALAEIPQRFQETPYSKNGWFEEDIDYLIVEAFVSGITVEKRKHAREWLSEYGEKHADDAPFYKELGAYLKDKVDD